MMVKFNLTPWIETQPKMTLDEAAAEMEKLAKRLAKLELETKRNKARQENLQNIIKHLEKVNHNAA
jgi:hypothetical protein